MIDYEYERGIEKLASQIIDNKEYNSLKGILKLYDRFAKEAFNFPEIEPKVPFWEYVCDFRNNE